MNLLSELNAIERAIETTTASGIVEGKESDIQTSKNYCVRARHSIDTGHYMESRFHLNQARKYLKAAQDK